MQTIMKYDRDGMKEAKQMKRFGMIILAVFICAGACLFPAFAENITTLSGENVFERQNTDVTAVIYDEVTTAFAGKYKPSLLQDVTAGDATVYNVLCRDDNGDHLIITAKINDDGSTETLGIKEAEISNTKEFDEYCSIKDLDEYEMWEILERADLTELYKENHPFLDDMNYIPVENAKTVQEIGYSHIWRVLAVRAIGDNGGEIEHLYENVPAFFFDEFVKAENADLYYEETIKSAFVEK